MVQYYKYISYNEEDKINKYNHKKIDWSECSLVDIENANRHIMDIELPENKEDNARYVQKG